MVKKKNKKQKRRLITKRKYGAIIFLDALGTKGIWKNKPPKEALSEWEDMIKEAKLYFRQQARNAKVKLSFLVFSDTIIITLTQGDIRDLVINAGYFAEIMVRGSFGFSKFFRGCISIGEFYGSKNLIVGPAIDEAAEYYSQAEWVGVMAAPSAYSIIKKIANNSDFGKFVKDAYIEYDVPLRNGRKFSTWVCKLDHSYNLKEMKIKTVTNAKTILDYVHEKLEYSTDVDASEKWKNTLDFLYHVKSHK